MDSVGSSRNHSFSEAIDCIAKFAVLPPDASGWRLDARKRSMSLFFVMLQSQARKAPLVPVGRNVSRRFASTKKTS